MNINVKTQNCQMAIFSLFLNILNEQIAIFLLTNGRFGKRKKWKLQTIKPFCDNRKID